MFFLAKSWVHHNFFESDIYRAQKQMSLDQYLQNFMDDVECKIAEIQLKRRTSVRHDKSALILSFHRLILAVIVVS